MKLTGAFRSSNFDLGFVLVFVSGLVWADVAFLSVVSADDWPRFLGPNFDGVASADADSIDWTKAPESAWSLEVGDGYGLGCVVGGRYYHFDSTQDQRTRATSQRLRCINLADGSEVWSRASTITYRDMYGYEDGPRSGPTVDGNRIYVHGVGGLLECRTLDSGDSVWSVDTTKQFGVVQNFFGVGGAPLIVGDLVIVMVGGSPASDARIAPGRLDRVSPNGSALVAFDKASGEQRWACGDDLASYSSPRTIVLNGKTFVLLFARDHLLMVDPATGTVNWQFKHRADILESVNAMVPLVSGDHVLISECYDLGSVLLKVTAQAAEVVWRDPPGDRRRQALRSHWSGPALHDGALFGCSGRNAPDSEFRCIDFATGKVQWSGMPRRRSAVTRVGGVLLVWQERGELHVIAADKTELKEIAVHDFSIGATGRPALRYPCWAAPIVVGDRLLLRGDRHVLCLKLKKP